jgi:Lon protease-like protein
MRFEHRSRMSNSERALEGLSRLAIFPLPEVVLLPHELVPLHIFEPRYREMTRTCLDGKAALALAQIRPATRRERELSPVPRVLPIVGVGLICESEQQEDGRFNIVLEGLCRARIIEELVTDAPYRLVRAERLEDLEAGTTQARDASDQLDGLLLALCRARPGKGVEALIDHAARAESPGQLADRVGAAVIEAPRERQALLEELSVPRRLQLVSHAVANLLAQVMPRPEQLN